MSNNDNVTDLCERLRAHRTVVVCGVRMPDYLNYDGPEAADTIERQAAEIERLRGKVASWAEQIDAISWTVNTSALDGLISEMRRTALTGEDND